MMNNDESREEADERSPLGRRSYLKAAVSAAAVGIAGVGSATAAGADYDVIEVPAGSTHTIQLGDGETLENTLIDISATGAQYQITAIGSDWAIRNVGVRGVWDRNEKAEPLIVSVPNGAGAARIENLYLGDGAYDDTYPGATGIYVANNHAGTLEIDRVNIQGFPDNAIYGSSPGDTDAHSSGRGGGGVVRITNSYAADCRASGFRVGSDGSSIENCVAVGCDRNVWGFYNDTDVIDCDFSNARIGDIATGDSVWRDTATVSVTNTRFETTASHSGQVVGQSAGTPQRTEPSDVDGVPLTATDAAAGVSRSSSSNTPESNEDEEEAVEEEETEDEQAVETENHLLAFVTEPDSSFAGYEFTAEGTVEFAAAPYDSPSGRSIEGGTYVAADFIDEDGETVRAGGITGGGHGDAFVVDGSITSIEIEQSDVMWVELDGEVLAPDEIIEATGGDEETKDEATEDADEPDLLAFVTEPDARFASYEFTADGPVEFTEAPYDSPSGRSIEGGTYVAEDFIDDDGETVHAGGITGGGHGDAFRVDGPITSIEIEQSDVMWVELNGEELSPDEIVDESC
ncbi:hypothetical protein [Natronorubrum sulfidifaciens]|uniref:Right handed beta helix domain-containing protein n=1 Tax=Natronorubrum sulfidifaciens JCM 14089 TaxID=1230460 RepID=L9WJH6_9EURY|nr:hypothetical protein [Natronorubrum sulfidifaciens]ELY49386.1 hypothetical protein C495_00435 [Natronorubrum sulfidifaciens JCM 14089]